jgi:hypothetical protein
MSRQVKNIIRSSDIQALRAWQFSVQLRPANRRKPIQLQTHSQVNLPPLPQIDIQTRSNIVIAGRAGYGRMAVDMAASKQRLIEIMPVFTILQQKTVQ